VKHILVALLFCLTLVGNGQTGELFQNGSVKLAYHPSPLFYVFNYSSTNKAASSGWLLVKVNYTPKTMKKLNKVMWLDDVTMESEVIIPASYKSKNVTVLLRGTTVFWSIPLDGKKHQAWGCIPPQVVARFARKGDKIDLQKAIARVTFYTSGRKILMREYSTSSSKARAFFEKLTGAVTSGVLTVDDIILPRTKTPWNVINYEMFDLIKPDPQK
jgi:hypothetical protein